MLYADDESDFNFFYREYGLFASCLIELLNKAETIRLKSIWQWFLILPLFLAAPSFVLPILLESPSLSKSIWRWLLIPTLYLLAVPLLILLMPFIWVLSRAMAEKNWEQGDL